MRIYIIRHGQTTGDIEDRYGGDYDDHLTDLGNQQSAEVAKLLADKGVQKLLASPRIRAQETAAVLGKELSIPVQAFDEFRERNAYGILTGLTKQEAAQKYPDQVELLKDVHAAVEGAEEYGSFQRRIITALDILRNVTADKVAVVSHGGPIRLIFRDILKQGEVEVEDCAYMVLETDESGYRLLETRGIKPKG
ncbi:MAG TPA: histidine phosphatase family protein [Candidatus Limnocylindria bacterium]|nr:histidine phosphatase family protein [Candidatus Limnocylindria bacterium]